MSTTAAQIQSPLLSLVVRGDPALRQQGSSTECAGAALLLAELGAPFDVRGFVAEGPGEAEEIRAIVREHFPATLSRLPAASVPLLVDTTTGKCYVGSRQILEFVRAMPPEVSRLADKKALQHLSAEPEGRFGASDLGRMDSNSNKIVADVRKIVAHGPDEKELPNWIDLIHLLKDIDASLESLSSMHPSGTAFLNPQDPSRPGSLDCFAAPALYFAEVALRTARKWDMVRDHKFAHLRAYLDAFLARPSWAAAAIGEEEVRACVERLAPHAAGWRRADAQAEAKLEVGGVARVG